MKTKNLKTRNSMLNNEYSYRSQLDSKNSSSSIDSSSGIFKEEDTSTGFQFTDINGYALPSESLPQVYKQYIVNKYQLANPLLKNDWKRLLPTAENFISLVDKNQVAFNVSVKELNRILLSGYFTMDEQQAIKRMRYQGRNNQAAKVMREKYKQKDRSVSYDLKNLEKEKLELITEKERLLAEIKHYKILISN